MVTIGSEWRKNLDHKWAGSQRFSRFLPEQNQMRAENAKITAFIVTRDMAGVQRDRTR